MGWNPDYATGASADSCWFLFAVDLQSQETFRKISHLGIVAVALLVNFIMTILIWNPLEVGCKKLFIQCEYGTAETRCIWSVINRRDI